MSDRPSQLAPAIHRVPLDKLTIYEITEAELDALESGSPESLFLNLAIAAISTALSFFTALLTTSISDLKIFCVFVIVCVVGFVAGASFGMLWWQSRRTLRNVAREIRKRKPPEGIPAVSGGN